ncbi:hypothetical protein DL96DRAFT_1713026 [Flagelloscypha sp. PMI_526]|nr:hypothetical protein DL96DRAFT_1713026 [Flagelloscypha sp. PMI_526]
MASLKLRKFPSLWYEDAGIVLRAGNCLFRVYQHTLVQQCAVFNDMFNIAQEGKSEQDKYAGCPLIVLHDNENELMWFLLAIFDSKSFPSDTIPTDQRYGQVSSILRLSDKYDNTGLKVRALRRLTEAFCDSKPFTSQSLRFREPSLPMSLRDHYHCIPFFLKMGVPWLIPHALLALVYAERSIELDVVQQWKEWPEIAAHVLQGLRLHAAFFHFQIRSMTFRCADKNDLCQASMVEFNGQLNTKLCQIPIENQGLPIHLERVFDHFRAAFSRPNYCPSIGRACRRKITTVLRGCTDAQWAVLPGLYGFGSWEELDVLKAKALS